MMDNLELLICMLLLISFSAFAYRWVWRPRGGGASLPLHTRSMLSFRQVYRVVLVNNFWRFVENGGGCLVRSGGDCL